MKLCPDCRDLVGQPLVRTGRHIGLKACYERQLIGAESDPAAVYQYYECEGCGAVLGRQKAPPTPDAVWQLIAEPAEEDECAFLQVHGGGIAIH